MIILLQNFHEIKIFTRCRSGDLKSLAIRSKSIAIKNKVPNPWEGARAGKPILGGGNSRPPSDPQMTSLNLGHPLSLDHFHIVGTSQNQIYLRILESLHILKKKPDLNDIQSAFPLSIYCTIVINFLPLPLHFSSFSEVDSIDYLFILYIYLFVFSSLSFLVILVKVLIFHFQNSFTHIFVMWSFCRSINVFLKMPLAEGETLKCLLKAFI